MCPLRIVVGLQTMAWDLFLWILSFFISLALVASVFYQVICLTDLEADYLNPFETSSRINRLVIPEFILQGSLCILFLFTWHWLFFLVALPVTCYHAMLYNERRHLIDVTEVFRGISFEKKFRFTKLGFYIFLFIMVVFRLTLSAVYSFTEDDDLLHLF